MVGKLTWWNLTRINFNVESPTQEEKISRDITITNILGSKIVDGWKVDMMESHSDHRYINFSRRNLKKANWFTFTNTLINSTQL